MTVTRHATVKTRDGLHVRPVSALAALCRRHASTVRLRKKNALPDDPCANGREMFELMILAAQYGEGIVVEVEGEDAEALAAAVCELIETDFDNG